MLLAVLRTTELPPRLTYSMQACLVANISRCDLQCRQAATRHLTKCCIIYASLNSDCGGRCRLARSGSSQTQKAGPMAKGCQVEPPFLAQATHASAKALLRQKQCNSDVRLWSSRSMWLRHPLTCRHACNDSDGESGSRYSQHSACLGSHAYVLHSLSCMRERMLRAACCRVAYTSEVITQAQASSHRHEPTPPAQER